MKDVEGRKRHVLEEFGFFMDGRKGGRWGIAEIGAEDARAYYEHIKRQGRGGFYVMERIKALNYFMDYLAGQGLVNKRPWQSLSAGAKKEERSWRTEELRQKLLERAKALRAEDLFGKRDKALLFLRLGERITNRELARMDLKDYNGQELYVPSLYEWRKRTVRLEASAREALDGYLEARLAEAPETEALFIGWTRKRIHPDTIRDRVKAYARLA
jgi:site-specific recombinase XerC